MSPALGDPRIPAVVARLSEPDAGPLVRLAADLVGAPALHDALQAEGWHVAAIDLEARDKAALLHALYRALDRPGSAPNWDALLDLLRDLSWLEPAAGIVLVWGDPDALIYHAPGDAATFVDVLEDAHAFRAARGYPPLRVIAPLGTPA